MSLKKQHLASLTAQDFIRHSRSIMHWGEPTQLQLAGKKVLILGLGGLGCHVALSLCAAGVGALLLIDDDKVELSNLPRQTLYRQLDIGQPKVLAAQRTLQAHNPACQIMVYQGRPEQSTLRELAAECDLLLDCSDNLPTRLMLDKVSRAIQRPLFAAAVSASSAQLYLLSQQHACYHCLAGHTSVASQNCANLGVQPALAALTAQQLAYLTLEYLAGQPVPQDQFALWQANQFRFYPLKRDSQCQHCAKPREE